MKWILLSQTPQTQGSPAFPGVAERLSTLGQYLGIWWRWGPKPLSLGNPSVTFKEGICPFASKMWKLYSFHPFLLMITKQLLLQKKAKGHPKKGIKKNSELCMPFSLPKTFQVNNFWLLPAAVPLAEWMEAAETGQLSARRARICSWKEPLGIESPSLCSQIASHSSSGPEKGCKSLQRVSLIWGAGDGAKSVFSHKSRQRVYHCNWCQTFSLTCFINPEQLWSPCLCL